MENLRVFADMLPGFYYKAGVAVGEYVPGHLWSWKSSYSTRQTNSKVVVSYDSLQAI